MLPHALLPKSPGVSGISPVQDRLDAQRRAATARKSIRRSCQTAPWSRKPKWITYGAWWREVGLSRHHHATHTVKQLYKVEKNLRIPDESPNRENSRKLPHFYSRIRLDCK